MRIQFGNSSCYGGIVGDFDSQSMQVIFYTGDRFDRWGKRHDGKYLTRKVFKKGIAYYFKYNCSIWYCYIPEKWL